jgi:hypothetical protein
MVVRREKNRSLKRVKGKMKKGKTERRKVGGEEQEKGDKAFLESNE